MDYVQPAINSMQSVIDYMKPAIDYAQPVIDSGKKFAKDSIRLLNKCTKPDRKEYQKIAFATMIGFAVMGFIGFIVKVIHIPIHNIMFK